MISGLRSLARDEVVFSRKMTSRIVEELSRSNLESKLSEEILSKLTPRELDVLGELQTGAANSEIAKRMFLSENTVKHHIQNILSKLGVENRRQASQLARQAGLQSKFPGT